MTFRSKRGVVKETKMLQFSSNSLKWVIVVSNVLFNETFQEKVLCLQIKSFLDTTNLRKKQHYVCIFLSLGLSNKRNYTLSCLVWLP